MKKIIKKLKGKKVLSLVLAAIMLATTFNIALPQLKLGAEAADITIGGVSQTRVVGTDGSYAATYENYAAQYLNGASNPTNIVIPGLNITTQDATDSDPGDYVIQGMTYYPEKDWMLVTAYHNDASETNVVSSKVFALDAATGDFVAMFDFLNADGTTNIDHGGGIAISENNLYYACGDKDRKIAYAPLSEFDVEVGTYKTVTLADSVELYEFGESYTAYVCFDEGILWTGNFFDLGTTVAGVYPVANEYNTPANDAANSMVFGYDLEGDNSTDEWNNFKSLVGSPSYALALSNAIKDVQYAVVDNGKLYLSRSYGSGAGNSVSFGFGNCSWLTVADIDLSQLGDIDITINDSASTTKSIKAYSIETFENYPMMPMSEGLCVIEGDIFITFEGASNKYLNESDSSILGLVETSISNCEKPVDVIWQLDPYKLMEQEVAEPEHSIYYEKLDNLSDIKDGEEYIIVHESNREDPVTQKNVLYALNADGNFKGYKLSKSSISTVKGYDGMIGHPISYYTLGKNDAGKDILYLDNPEEDDVENIRWTISSIGDSKYSIKTTETYFANTNCFYFDEDQITMAPSGAPYLSTITIGQLVENNGCFYFSNNNAYLWCNDGVNQNYNDKANAYYANNAATYPIFDGVTEIAGTFHCDATNTTNIIGQRIQDENDRAFYIYKRVKDDISSTYESRVFTDLNAELQADGTYTVDLETYAISPNHYQYVGERPTDYIFVVDTSSSMGTQDGAGLISYGGSATGENLAINSLCQKTDIDGDAGQGINGYNFTKPNEDIYYLHSDGNYYQLKLAVNTPKLNGFELFGNYTVTSITQNYWAYYIADDGLYYVLQCENSTNGVFTGITYETFISNVENNVSYTRTTNKTSAGDRYDLTASTDPHYRFDTNTGEDTRLSSIQTIATDLVDDIYAQNEDNRIALVQYGGSNGFYNNTSGQLDTINYTNAFWGSDSATTLVSTINGLTTSAQSDDSGIEMEYANEVMSNSDADYTSTGDRNIIIFFMSDGVPGTDSGSNTVTAANNVISAAKTAKDNGAFIYSVLVGHETVSGFSTKEYMDAVSSKYQGATSMTALGGQNVDGVIYAHTLASITLKNFTKFGQNAVKQAAVNTVVGLANLDANSILREELSDSFIIPEGTQPVAKFIKGEFDAIGRFAFDEDNLLDATGVTVTTDDDDAGNFTIKGYNYATQYIAKGKTGYKLRVRLEGVLADKTKTIQNTPISNTDTTALYQNSTQMANGVMFKQLPTSYLNIPEYTYVLDYGVNMLDQDVNGTMLALDDGPDAQPKDSEGKITYSNATPNQLIEKTNSNQDLIYKMTPTSTGDEGYVLIDREDGSYDWFKLKVVPASNVLYEESSMTMKDDENVVAWTHEGTATSQKQDVSNDGDVYGYDSNYANSTGFSNGTHYYATVDSDTRFSDTASVTFKGTGVDLLSACGPNTGVQLVTIKKDGNFLKGFVVDTYYKDTSVLAENELLHQVPIVKWTGEYDEYTVETKAYYLSGAGAIKNRSSSAIVNSLIDTGLVMNSAEFDGNAEIAKIIESEGWDKDDVELIWFDDNSVLNGGTGVAPTRTGARSGDGTSVTLDNYIDGFRVYNPVEDTSNYIESEQSPVYYNVIDELVAGDTITSSGIGDGIAYITGSLTSTDADGNEVTETLSFSNYENFGPTDELYLKGGATNGITFNTPVEDGGRVMVSLRAVNSASTTTKAKINGTEFAINSATEMYYDITDLLTVEEGKANVTIINSGSGILAVNNIKLTNTASGASLMMLSMDDMETVQYYAAMEPVQATVKNGVVTPVVEEEEIPEDNTNTDTDTDTETEETEKEEFSLFSLIELLIVFIEKILRSAFGAGNIF